METIKKISLMMCIVMVMGIGAAVAATVPITWLDMSPTPFNTTVPFGLVVNVAGVGNVTVTYSLPMDWLHERAQLANFTTGSVTSGPDTWTWANYDYFSTMFTAGDLGPFTGVITYTFPTTLAAGSVFVGAMGLGATTSFGGGASTTTVNQNGTYLGEFVGDAAFGATQFTGGAGTFTMQNSVTGAGGANPWWNTNLGVVRIDDAVASITVVQSMIRGDGIGVNIGFALDSVIANTSSSWSDIKALYR